MRIKIWYDKTTDIIYHVSYKYCVSEGRGDRDICLITDKSRARKIWDRDIYKEEDVFFVSSFLLNHVTYILRLCESIFHLLYVFITDLSLSYLFSVYYFYYSFSIPTSFLFDWPHFFSFLFCSIIFYISINNGIGL